MIRFIDIRGYGTGYRFSFFDTVIDRYLVFNGSCVWDNLDEFCSDAAIDPELMIRCRRLIPVWAIEDDPNDPLWGEQ